MYCDDIEPIITIVSTIACGLRRLTHNAVIKTFFLDIVDPLIESNFLLPLKASIKDFEPSQDRNNTPTICNERMMATFEEIICATPKMLNVISIISHITHTKQAREI